MAETGSLSFSGFIFQNTLVRQDLEGSLIPGATPGLITSGFETELLGHHFAGAGRGEREAELSGEQQGSSPLLPWGLESFRVQDLHSCPFADTW